MTGPIRIDDYSWVTSGVFVGPGVQVHEGAVVAARSSVTRNVPAWTIVAGVPAKRIGTRDRNKFLGHRATEE